MVYLVASPGGQAHGRVNASAMASVPGPGRLSPAWGAGTRWKWFGDFAGRTRWPRLKLANGLETPPASCGAHQRLGWCRYRTAVPSKCDRCPIARALDAKSPPLSGSDLPHPPFAHEAQTFPHRVASVNETSIHRAETPRFARTASWPWQARQSRQTFWQRSAGGAAPGWRQHTLWFEAQKPSAYKGGGAMVCSRVCGHPVSTILRPSYAITTITLRHNQLPQARLMGDHQQPHTVVPRQ